MLSRLLAHLRDPVTQDTGKPEIQPVNESKSLHSCVLS